MQLVIAIYVKIEIELNIKLKRQDIQQNIVPNI